MLQLWQRFVVGVSANAVARLGAAITTASFVLFVGFEFFNMLGILKNPYFDMLVFLTLPTLMAGGLGLVAIGWLHFAKKQKEAGRSITDVLAERFGKAEIRPKVGGTRLLWTVLGLSLINAVVMGGISFQAKSFMDSREFCGTACHVMDPEWRAYQAGPHAGVDCVDCHVGEGMGALIESKIGGARQMIREMTNTYSRPIPTPVHQFRSTEETCARCHQRGADMGQKLVVHERFAHDENSSPLVSALKMKIGGGESPGAHFHARRDVKIEYTSVDEKREVVLALEVTRPDGTLVKYSRSDLSESLADPEQEPRLMDCTDCHNRTGHPFSTPEAAIDKALAEGKLDRSLPRIKDKSYGVLTGAVPRSTHGGSTLDRVTLALQRYFASTDPQVSHEKARSVSQAAETLTDIYELNVHPEMEIDFNSYPDHSAHRGQTDGCFRCHTKEMVSENGVQLPSDCNLCHEVLADEKPWGEFVVPKSQVAGEPAASGAPDGSHSH